MFIRRLAKITPVMLSIMLLYSACAKLPQDIKIYGIDEFNVYEGSNGRWQVIYALERSGPQWLEAMGYDAANNLIAISLRPSSRTKGSAKILLIDQNTHKVVREIYTGMDWIRNIVFNRDGKKIAIIEQQYSTGSNKLYILTLANVSFQYVTMGDFFNASWDADNSIYLSYKENGKRYVGNINTERKDGVINKIAEGFYVSASDKKDAFIYIDMKGDVNYNEKGRPLKTLPLPTKFHGEDTLSSAAFVNGSNDIIVAKRYYRGDALFLLKPPYTNAQMIYEYRLLDYVAVSNRT